MATDRKNATSIDGKMFERYAAAEKELCHIAGPAMTRLIHDIESRYGICIAELRVTMDRSSLSNGASTGASVANCTLVRDVPMPPQGSAWLGTVRELTEVHKMHSQRAGLGIEAAPRGYVARAGVDVSRADAR